MTEYFELDRLMKRPKPQPGEHAPDVGPGVDLRAGMLPMYRIGDQKFADFAYAHVSRVVGSEVVPSAITAVDAETRKVTEPGVIVLVDLRAKPPQFVRKMGAFSLGHQGLQYNPNIGF